MANFFDVAGPISLVLILLVFLSWLCYSTVEITLEEPWYRHVLSGRKKYIIVLFRGPYRRLQPGQYVRVRSGTDRSDPARLCKIMAIDHAETTRELLQTHGADDLPGVKGIDTGLAVYRRQYSEADERQFGVMGLQLGD